MGLQRIKMRWYNMVARCDDPRHPNYADYGGRGIYVCAEWQDFDSFKKWFDANCIDGKHQLDRIDNDGPYTPENCRFVTREANARNKRNTIMLSAFGETKPMRDWADDPRCAVSISTLIGRVRVGWPHEQAITLGFNATRKGKLSKNAKMITAWGETKSTSEWIRDSRCAIKNHQSIWQRINKYGWTPEEALATPSRTR